MADKMPAAKLPAKIIDGIMAVRETGETNMFDINSVLVIADRLKLYDLFVWLYDERENQRQYMQGIRNGFEPDDSNAEKE